MPAARDRSRCATATSRPARRSALPRRSGRPARASSAPRRRPPPRARRQREQRAEPAQRAPHAPSVRWRRSRYVESSSVAATSSTTPLPCFSTVRRPLSWSARCAATLVQRSSSVSTGIPAGFGERRRELLRRFRLRPRAAAHVQRQADDGGADAALAHQLGERREIRALRAPLQHARRKRDAAVLVRDGEADASRSQVDAEHSHGLNLGNHPGSAKWNSSRTTLPLRTV